YTQPSYPLLILIPRPSPSTLSPYTTLFRSPVIARTAAMHIADNTCIFFITKRSSLSLKIFLQVAPENNNGFIQIVGLLRLLIFRSEEHTSELQSRLDIVCRLLLENNNTTT